MSETPEPGEVLNGESVKLLLPGDVLRHVEIHSFQRTLRRTSGDYPDLWLHFEEDRDSATLCDRFTFVSRPSTTPTPASDGVWLTADQLQEVLESFVDRADVSEIAAKINAVINAAQPHPSQQAGTEGGKLTLAEVEETIIQNLRIRGMRSHEVPAVQDVFAALDEWKAIADREFANRTGARAEATKLRHLLGELLAVIHRDGGHKVESVGIEAATSEAISIHLAALNPSEARG